MGKSIATIFFIVLILVSTVSIRYANRHADPMVENHFLPCEHDIRHSTTQNSILLAQKDNKERVDLIAHGIVIIANISKTTYLVARWNASFLYAKTHIFLYIQGELNETITDKNKRIVSIEQNNTKYIVYVKWVNSITEIPEVQKEIAAEVPEPQVITYVIGAVIATFFALGVSIFIALLLKKYEIKEGLPKKM